jgi:hypothetical protein
VESVARRDERRRQRQQGTRHSPVRRHPPSTPRTRRSTAKSSATNRSRRKKHAGLLGARRGLGQLDLHAAGRPGNTKWRSCKAAATEGAEVAVEVAGQDAHVHGHRHRAFPALHPADDRHGRSPVERADSRA